MTEQKRIPITDAKSGLTRYSEPNPYPAPGKQPEAQKDVGPSEGKKEATSVASTDDVESAGAASTKPEKGRKQPSSKPKTEISNLEQFIAHAYGLKGRKVPLKPKVERQIAQDPRLSDEARARLSELSAIDKFFAVPRQLLLVSRQVSGYPALRAALRDFVRDRMLGHPLFSRSGIEAAVRNLDDAPPPAEVLKQLVLSTKAVFPEEQAKSLKDAELEQLRTNAVYCMAAWLADAKGLAVASVIDMLYAALWAPKAKELGSDTRKLEALTSIAEFGGVGLACEDYRRQASERLLASEAAAREAESLRVQVANLKSELAAATAAAEQTQTEWKSTETALKAQLESIRAEAETKATHLRDDLEQQRTRLLRRLDADVHMLEQGLQALTRDPPKVHIMVDHAERVTDALRQEIKKLQGDE